MFKKILACTDGSACALDAMRMTASIAKRFDSEVLALNVFQEPYADYAQLGVWAMSIDPEMLDRVAEEEKDGLRLHIGSLFERLNVRFQMLQATGHPVKGILRVAEREQVDLI